MVYGNYSKLFRFKNLVQKIELNSIAFDFSIAKKLSQKLKNSITFSDFLIGYISVSFYWLYSLCSYYVHVAEKTVTCCTKSYAVSTKKIFHIEKRCAPKLCVSQKNILC